MDAALLGCLDVSDDQDRIAEQFNLARGHHQAGRLEVHHRMPLSGALGIPTTSRGIQLQQRVTLSMKAKRSKTQRLNAIASWDFSERAAEF